MDKRIEWPWSLEEEAEWKSELAERDREAAEELMSETVDQGTTGPPEVLGVPEDESAEKTPPEKYSITT